MYKINVCLAFDENYSYLAKVSIISILKNNDKVNLFILDNGISFQSKNDIKKICNDFNANISFFDCKEIVDFLMYRKFNSQGMYNSYSAYLRLFIIDFLPDDVERILYIDCDVTCESSLDSLFNLDLKGKTLAAVTDVLPSFHKEYIGFNYKDYYYNSGVLLIDVYSWKNSLYTNKIKKQLNDKRTNYPYHDQDLINIIFKNDIYRLPPKYMVIFPIYKWGKNIIYKYLDTYVTYEDHEYNEALKRPVLIHHLDNIEGRPWEKSVSPKSEGLKYWKSHHIDIYFNNNFYIRGEKSSLKLSLLRYLYNYFPSIYFFYMRKNRNKAVKMRCEKYKGEI